MTIPVGPHQRRGRRRRRGKALVLGLVLVMIEVMSSWTWWDKPASPRWRPPDESALAWLVTQAWLSPADGRAFADQHPELSDLFLSASMGPAPWEDQ